MTPRELFAVGVRIVGVVVLVYGLCDLVNAGLLHYEYFKMPDSSSGFYVLAGIASIIIGLYLTSGGIAPCEFRLSL